MRKRIYLIIISSLLTISTLFFIPNNKTAEQPEVLVTIAPHKYFVERLTDHSVQVKNLVPPEADPHGFGPSAKELVGLFSAKIWFLSGEPFENHFIPIIKKNDPDLVVMELKENIDILHCSCCHNHHHHDKAHHHTEDLHFWMSPQIAKMQCQKMAKELKVIFPEKAELIDQQLVKLNLDFDRLDAYLTDQLKDLEGTSFLVSHPAFGYFAKQYNLNQLSLENEGQDPNPKEFAELLRSIETEHIQNLYVQKQYNYKASQQLAKAKHLKLVEVNPYAENYFENMREFGKHLGAEHD
jgi:zinc transport system substrate-binding protein